MKSSVAFLASATMWVAGASAQAFERVRFVVVDPVTRLPVAGARVSIQDLSGHHGLRSIPAGYFEPKPTQAFDLRAWLPTHETEDVLTITLPLDTPITLQNAQSPALKEFTIKVSATRIVPKANATAGSTTIGKNEISKFINTAGGDSKKLTQGQSGVASDSAGQQHVRGEHTEITYVVDGVPLPDTLSGRQGSIVVPSTIENLEIITGGFAPEFGGQTAAVLNIATLPNAKVFNAEATLQAGSYRTVNGDFTVVGPLARRGSFVVNVGSTRTNNAVEPQQPDAQTAHNRAENLNLFGKLKLGATARDSITITLSKNPGRLENNNRTGLPASFADVGQGYGFLGLRNADGSRPDVTPESAGKQGSETILLADQETAKQDIYLKEISEFVSLNWVHRLRGSGLAQISVTGLHSGQDVHNNNPAVDVLNLPIDSSIEFNPVATRNVHHLQLQGSLSEKHRNHALKAGFVYDSQSGRETYQLTPGSRLALNALAALDLRLVPEGSFETDEGGNQVLDVNGNPVFVPTSGTVPALAVQRQGYYAAGYIQDTWQVSRRLLANFGLRMDWFHQSQDPGDPVNASLLSPRMNLSYMADGRTTFRTSFNRLFNTPPLAQGAIVGLPIQPATLDQYDLSVERKTGDGQTLKLAYYYKDIRNQVDVGLLVPGSQIGLYSAINLERGGVHGLELSYDIANQNGWDAYFNYSMSRAAPNGVDNTGEPVEEFNDHDQRHTIGAGIAYGWKSGATLAATLTWGSGLASSGVGNGKRTPRFQLDLRASSGDGLFGGHGGVGIDIENVFDSRRVINFQSAFSGTRFQQGRRVLVSAFWKY